jgi:ABC-type Fe3+/spermidine/putrescine transport system ATPase subunit
MEAFGLAERVAVMNCGEIVQVDQTKTLLFNPNDEFVAKFLGYENIFKGRLVKQDGRLSFIEVEGFVIRAIGHPKDDYCTIGIRPEDISLSGKPVFSSHMNVLSGAVTDCMDMGPIVSVSVDSALRVRATVNKGSFLELNPDIGTQIWLSFKPESVKILNKHQASG